MDVNVIMDVKGKERGILKLEPQRRLGAEGRGDLTPQGSCDHAPVSPQPSVDRLSVTWASPEPGMASAGLFHLPTDAPVPNEVKFSPNAGAEGSDDEDYSASLSAVLRQRRASVRRSRKGRARRPSSPFLPDDTRPRRRSSVFTTSSGDTAISMEDCQSSAVVTQEQIFENIHLHKEVLGSVKQQPLGMRRKLKIVHQAKAYIKRHEGQLQERLAQSKCTRDIYARFNIFLTTKWQQLKREAANTSNLLIPWELRIKEIESHFGSVVASYFTFLRWLFWVNLVVGLILLVFVIVPECLTAHPNQDGERKIIMEEERANASNLLMLWEFEGVLKFSPIFYGYYSNVERPQYRMPLAYFLTGLVVYIYSFVAILRKMAENSRMSKLSEKEDECIFSWKLFTGWDFMIGNTETAHNRIASVILGFKEALLEEAEKKKDLGNWRIISLRAIVNICVVVLLVVSAYAVVTVVTRSDDKSRPRNWWRENETTVVVTVISITFPVFFEVLGYLEHYHPRKQLRLQLARIMLLNLLNLYSLIFAQFSKIEGMSEELNSLKPALNTSATTALNNTVNISETYILNLPMTCFEERVPCEPCNILPTIAVDLTTDETQTSKSSHINNEVNIIHKSEKKALERLREKLFIENLIEHSTNVNEQDIYNTETTLISDDYQDWMINNDIYTSTSNIDEILTKSTINDEYPTTSKDIVVENNTFKEEDETTTTNNNEETSTSTEIETTTMNSRLLIQKELEKLRNISRASATDNDPTIEFDGNNDDYTYDYINETEYVERDTKSTSNSYSSTVYTELNFTDMDLTPTQFLEINISTTEMGTSTVSNDSLETTDLTHSTMIDMDSTLQTVAANTTSYSTDTSSLTSDITSEIDTTYETTSGLLTTTKVTDAPYINTNITSTPVDLFETTSIVISKSTSSPTVTTLIDKSSTVVSTTPTDNKCPDIFNCTMHCGGRKIKQVFFISNCKIVEKRCYITKCEYAKDLEKEKTNETTVDIAYVNNNRKMYNLTKSTRKKLLKLCWETMFGQELVKLTMMDLVFVLLGTLFMDFFRALFVRYMNRCWCWDLEKKFPEYGDFKIAENILHLINNQGMVWMGMFFSPGLVVLNVVKLMIMMYLRSWAVMTCNVPHAVVFRVSKSNNFYLALLLTMLFLCVLPVGYTIFWVTPSWHCGPFSEYEKIYKILTNNIYKILPKSLNFALEYIASPAIVIPLLVLLILIIYYLTSLTNSLREANNDLKIQLRRERTEERRKMFQLADTRRRVGSSAMDNTPFARWKKALPSLPISKSIDSDDRKTITADDSSEPLKAVKRKGGIFAKIVGMALDKKTDVDIPEAINISQSSNNVDDETDTDFHETLPEEVLKIKDIIFKHADNRKKSNVEFKTDYARPRLTDIMGLKVKLEKEDERSEKKANSEKQKHDQGKEVSLSNKVTDGVNRASRRMDRKQTSETSTQSKQSDSTIGSVIPVITISTTESDEENVHSKKEINEDIKDTTKVSDTQAIGPAPEGLKRMKKSISDLKSLRRQSSVDSINEQKSPKEKKPEEGHKYQYSL